MSVYLYRWGKFAFRRKWIVLPVWLLLLVLLGGAAATLAKPFQDKFDMPGLPSERATEILEEHMPQYAEGFSIDAITATYVIAAKDGKLSDPNNMAALDAMVQKLNAPKLGDQEIVDHSQPIVNPVTATQMMPASPEAAKAQAEAMAALEPGQTPPIPSPNCLDNPEAPDFQGMCSGAPLNVLNEQKPGTVAVITVPFTMAEFSDVKPEHREAAEAVAEQAEEAGLTVAMTGVLAQEQPEQGTAEMIGIGVALIVMIIAFGALIAAFVPIITGIVGVGAAGLVIVMGTSLTAVPTFTPILASMIGLALSIDYALFIVSRYKHELVVQDSPEEAAGVAVGTAGSAVVFAGLTVLIALLGLSIVGVSFLTAMGIGGAIAAAFAVVTAITLLPALMGAFGRFLFKPKVPFVAKHDPEDDSSVTNGMRFAKLIAKAPAITLALCVVVLGALAAPAVNLNLGLPGGDSAPKDSSMRKAYELQTEGFGEGKNGMLVVAVDLSEVPQDQRDTALSELRDRLSGYEDMDYLTTAQPSEDGQAALFMAVPKSGPNSEATQDLVADVRDAEGEFTAKYGMEYGITGETAIYADVNHVLLASIVPYLAIVAGAAFLLLVLVFRSILVPLTAALGFLLSMAATFGVTVLFFQEGALGLIEDTHPIISFLPIMLIGIVFGLAMDYQVFLVTRMREEFVHGKSPKDAMIDGYHHGARVVTSAAVIMISVFAGFMLSPDITSKSMGFAMAAGVFFDAFLVRMVLIPSLLVLMGKWAWWLPAWLDRILPDIDVEGTKLRELQQRDAEAAKKPVEAGV
ncbi:MMPL family transporter [Nocardia cyriacigeorgica]|uniref:MMPL family transporter n=1 Tax=Nocardia cyriacigeorgica TaxID=135487 RepID=UPI0018943825|nr:MMPL family transporter [Nocardia cyriacigeorgica]MBF6324518.1 MMPL family transporter [Nocardia cyriacigeorgica]